MKNYLKDLKRKDHKRHLGGLDIFIAKTDKNTGKTKIEHPGYPLNSADDDFGITAGNKEAKEIKEKGNSAKKGKK